MKRHTLLTLLTATLLLGGCDSSTEPPDERRLTIVDPQISGGVGSVLPRPVIVAVTTTDGQPLRGVEVRWRVIHGGGAVDPATSITDSLGHARTEWRLGYDEGVQLLLATSATGSVTIQANAVFQIDSISAGFRHTCALSSDGAVYCWGSNSHGQFGNTLEAPSTTPVRTHGALRFASISVGWTHTCAVSVQGEAYCWGDNAGGQLGTGGARRSHLPARVATSDAFLSISAGYLHTCGVTASREVLCWGNGDFGQIGVLDPMVSTPRRVELPAPVASVSVGEFHTCAVTTSDEGYCWGLNGNGELGGARVPSVTATPTPVAGNTGFSTIAAGVRHSCGIERADRAVSCWGRNAAGEVGAAPLDHREVPHPLPGARQFTAVGAGNVHSCGIANEVFCWGSDGFNNSVNPAPVLRRPASALGVGFEHTCAIADGLVWCWGSNSHGQLGRTGPGGTAAPVQVEFPTR